MTTGTLVRIPGADLVTVQVGFIARMESSRAAVRSWFTWNFWRDSWMSPTQITLAGSERLVLVRQYHWFVPFADATRAFVAMPAPFVVNVAASFVNVSFVWAQALVWLLTIGHTAYMAYRVVEDRTRLIVVTNMRLIRTSGVFNKVRQSVMLHEIDTLTVSKCSGLWGWILRYGHLVVETAGPHDDPAKRQRIGFVPGALEVEEAILTGACGR